MAADLEGKIAVYCTADDNYVYPALIALDSVRRFHPGCSYFVIGNADLVSPRSIELLARHGIAFLHSDKNLHFASDVWPNTAYLTLFGPEILLERGFAFSLGLDPDVLCVAPLDLAAIFAATDGFAGIENQEPRSSNFPDPERVRALWHLTAETMAGKNTNTGVVFWNNRTVADFGLGERCINCYAELARCGTPVVGDQALFALVSVTGSGLPFHPLDYVYNYRVGNAKDLARPAEGVRIFHFTGMKPWQRWRPARLREYLFRPHWLKYHARWRAHVRRLGFAMPGAEVQC